MVDDSFVLRHALCIEHQVAISTQKVIIVVKIQSLLGQLTQQMKLYIVLVIFPSVYSSIPSYLDPGRRFMSRGAPENDDGGRYLNPLQQNQISVEDSLDAGKVQSYLQAPLMEHDIDGKEMCDALPNSTSSRPAFFVCNEGECHIYVPIFLQWILLHMEPTKCIRHYGITKYAFRSMFVGDDTPVYLHGGAITNMEGDDRYPISFDRPVRVFLDVTSSATRRYDNLGLDVSLYKRSNGWFGCGWMFLPSFGMLNNDDLCLDNPSCPLSPGRQVLEFSLDPSKLFTRLFRMIHYDMSAYQLVIRLRDNKDPFNELLCTTIQTRIRL
ncbi:hypothetical protein Q1695_000748 [Nippostrongylus brasiliensis]|nr:hypothetical protein Q1695_000748 [Nippostrongylus brasiliensis]